MLLFGLATQDTSRGDVLFVTDNLYSSVNLVPILSFDVAQIAMSDCSSRRYGSPPNSGSFAFDKRCRPTKKGVHFSPGRINSVFLERIDSLKYVIFKLH
jgi:hypothetical protein